MNTRHIPSNNRLAMLAILSASAWMGIASIASAQNNASALIGRISGDVNIVGTQGKTMQAKPYSQVGLGDVIQASPTASVQIIYMDSGKEEIWSGGGDIKIGTVASEGKNSQPQRVATLAPQILRQLKQMPSQLANQQTVRTGMVRMRNLSAERYRDLQETYHELKSKQTADSHLAEIYFLLSLQKERDFANMQNFLDSLSENAISSESLQQLRDIFEPLIKQALNAQSLTPAPAK